MGGNKQHKFSFSNGVSPPCVTFLCIASFFSGVLVVYWFQADPEPATLEGRSLYIQKQDGIQSQPLIDCDSREASLLANDIYSRVSHTHNAIMKLEKSMSALETQLDAARASRLHRQVSSPTTRNKGIEQQQMDRSKVFFVMGIITALSSRKRRDSIRGTWMPQGKLLEKLEKEKGIIVRFVIGHGANPGGVLDRAINAEEAQHRDILRLDHVEGYHELSSKTQVYFSTAVAKWDAEFYIKVDDDVHVNIGMVVSALTHHRSKPHVYIGCMKSGLAPSQKGVKYHEPEFWKFSKEGNKYFRHATGQIYALSKDLATYISVNRYANEDVSLGSWLIGLDVDHIDDRSLCCGTPLGEILVKIASEKHKPETLVPHHLTGAAVAYYVNHQSEWRRCTNDVVKVMKLFGTLVSKTYSFFFMAEISFSDDCLLNK